MHWLALQNPATYNSYCTTIKISYCKKDERRKTRERSMLSVLTTVLMTYIEKASRRGDHATKVQERSKNSGTALFTILSHRILPTISLLANALSQEHSLSCILQWR